MHKSQEEKNLCIMIARPPKVSIFPHSGLRPPPDGGLDDTGDYDIRLAGLMTLVTMTSANLRALQHDNNSDDADDVILGGHQQCKKRNTGGCNTMRPQTTNRDIMMHTFTLDIVLEGQIPKNSDELCQLFVSSPKIQIQIPKR